MPSTLPEHFVRALWLCRCTARPSRFVTGIRSCPHFVGKAIQISHAQPSLFRTSSIVLIHSFLVVLVLLIGWMFAPSSPLSNLNDLVACCMVGSSEAERYERTLHASLPLPNWQDRVRKSLVESMLNPGRAKPLLYKPISFKIQRVIALILCDPSMSQLLWIA